MKIKREKILNLILPLICALSILVVWVIASAKIDNEFILPSLNVTAERLFALLLSKDFYRSFLFTLFRSLISFILSFSLAFALALLCYRIKRASLIVEPFIRVIRALPTIAVVLLLLFWTNSKIAPVIVTFLVVMPTSYTHLSEAFFSIDKTVVEAGKVDGADGLNLSTRVEFPLIAPAFLSGIGSGISLNFKLMVAAEVLAQTANSIGYLLNTSKVYFEIADMMAIVVVAVLFSVIIEKFFTALSRKTGSWR